MAKPKKNCQIWKWVCAASILLGLVYLFRTYSIEEELKPVAETKGKKRETKGKKRGSVNYVNEDSLEFVYEALPEGRKVNGLVFLAHGCSHSGTDWWDKSERCPKCIGLPEEKVIVARLVEEGYVPLAVSSQDRLGSRCWHENDIKPVLQAVKIVREKLGLSTEPLFAFGASSGGTFVSRLGTDPSRGFMVTAPQLLIDAHPTKADERASSIYFTYMARSGSQKMYERVVEEYRKFGYNIRSRFLSPLPITPTFFADRIESISPKTSSLMVVALQEAELIDESGMLLENPRGSPWRKCLQKFAMSDSLVADVSPISEVMNVAFAQHEMSSEFVDEMIDFFKEVAQKA